MFHGSVLIYHAKFIFVKMIILRLVLYEINLNSFEPDTGMVHEKPNKYDNTI